MKEYFEKLYKVLFEINFSEITADEPIYKSLLTLILSSLFLCIPNNELNANCLYITNIYTYVINTIIIWIFSAIFFDMVAKIFNRGGKIKELLNKTGYTLLPLMFIAPFNLVKTSSELGYFFGTKMEILLLVWVIVLYAKVIEKTYDLTKTSSYLLIFLPTIAIGFAIIWLIGTFTNIGYIYTV